MNIMQNEQLNFFTNVKATRKGYRGRDMWIYYRNPEHHDDKPDIRYAGLSYSFIEKNKFPYEMDDAGRRVLRVAISVDKGVIVFNAPSAGIPPAQLITFTRPKSQSSYFCYDRALLAAIVDAWHLSGKVAMNEFKLSTTGQYGGQPTFNILSNAF